MNKEQYLEKIEIATSLLKDMEMTHGAGDVAIETKNNKRAVVKAIKGYLSSYAKYASLMVMFSLSASDVESERFVDNPRRLTEIQRYSDIGMCTCATLMSFTNATFFVVGVVNDFMDISSDKSTNEKVVDIYKGISGTLAFTYLGARYAKKTYSHIVDPI